MFCGEGRTAQQSTAAHGRQDKIKRRYLLEKFLGAGCLAFNNIVIVERMDLGGPGPCHHFRKCRLPRSKRGLAFENLTAVSANAALLDLRRSAWHHDVR